MKLFALIMASGAMIAPNINNLPGDSIPMSGDSPVYVLGQHTDFNRLIALARLTPDTDSDQQQHWQDSLSRGY